MAGSKPPVGAAWAPVTYEDADVNAFKALQKGEAQPEQQARALKFIVEKICGYYDLSYRPDSDRDTVFAEGRRFVGAQIVKLCNLPPSKRISDGRGSGNPTDGRELADDRGPGNKPG